MNIQLLEVILINALLETLFPMQCHIHLIYIQFVGDYTK